MENETYFIRKLYSLGSMFPQRSWRQNQVILEIRVSNQFLNQIIFFLLLLLQNRPPCKAKSPKQLVRGENETLVEFEQRQVEENMVLWRIGFSLHDLYLVCCSPLPSLLYAILKSQTHAFKIPSIDKKLSVIATLHF